MSLLEITFRTLRKHRLIPPESTVVVGVSGGPDSLALLHVLWQLRERFRCQLHAATLDHSLRGEDSAADAEFVRRIAQAWGISVTAGKVDVSNLVLSSGLGVEAAARRARYDFLADVAQQVGASRVAVAHHADDQAETVLMHILRGSGLSGLGGMALKSPLPQHPELTLIRPFLPVSRRLIEAYCREHGLQPREDVSNRDLTYLRNVIRWETLPHLGKLNPAVRQSLNQLADIAAHDDEYLDQQLRTTVIEPHVKIEAQRVVIVRAVFRQLHTALQRRFVYWAAQQIGSVEDVGYVHIVEAVELGQQGQVGAVALLTGGLQLRVDYDTLVTERIDAPQLPEGNYLAGDIEVAVTIPGLTTIPGAYWQLIALESLALDEANAPLRLAIPAESKVTLRTRRRGDRFTPLGLGGQRQKVSKWMIDHKVPKAVRDFIPLLLVDGEIAAILYRAQGTVAEPYAVRDVTQRVIYFHIERQS